MNCTTTPKSIIGVDVSKDKLDIHILSTNESITIKNDTWSINAFIKKLKKSHENLLIVMEYTGGLEKWMLESCNKQEVLVHIANPSRVYHFAKQKGYFAKTDKQDAVIIARYGEQEDVGENCGYYISNMPLRELNNRRAIIVADLRDEKCRLTRPVTAQVQRSIKRKIKYLENEKKLLDQEINKIIEQCPEKSAQVKRLQTCKGIGPTIAQGLVCLLPELGSLSRREVAAIIGVAPQNNDSGRKHGKRRIVGGRFNARRLLYMGALVASKFNPSAAKLYKRLINNGKPAKVALVAVMRKLIITLNAMIREGKNWQPNYTSVI